FGLQPRTIAGFAGCIRAVSRQQYPHMHFVGLGLEPRKEAPGPVPDTFVPVAFAFDDPLAPLGAELAPGSIQGNPALLRELEQIALTLLVGLSLPGLDRPAAQRFAFIRNDEPVVDADCAAETPAGFTGPHGGVEREKAW